MFNKSHYFLAAKGPALVFFFLKRDDHFTKWVSFLGISLKKVQLHNRGVYLVIDSYKEEKVNKQCIKKITVLICKIIFKIIKRLIEDD